MHQKHYLMAFQHLRKVWTTLWTNWIYSRALSPSSFRQCLFSRHYGVHQPLTAHYLPFTLRKCHNSQISVYELPGRTWWMPVPVLVPWCSSFFWFAFRCTVRVVEISWWRQCLVIRQREDYSSLSVRAAWWREFCAGAWCSGNCYPFLHPCVSHLFVAYVRFL